MSNIELIHKIVKSNLRKKLSFFMVETINIIKNIKKKTLLIIGNREKNYLHRINKKHFEIIK